MARVVGKNEDQQLKIALESQFESQRVVGERYGIKKSTVGYYRAKFGVTKSPPPIGRPKPDKAAKYEEYDDNKIRHNPDARIPFPTMAGLGIVV
jgi:hypothetical protein